ncbi:MAG: hypothetical protein ACXACX_13625 [Candidatus Hodarchaeales archaeon]|jgi:hypothetical protein
MAEDILLENLRVIGYLLSATLIPLATLILGRKILKEKRGTGRYNNVRLIIFCIFSCFAMMSVLECLVEFSLFPGELFGYNIAHVNLYSILIGTMVSLGLSLVFYINRWEAFYFVSLFIFGGMVIFYYLTGFSGWIEWYIQIAAIFSLAFIYLTSFQVKDNGAFGLAIFFTLAFSTLVIEISIINQIIILGYNVFILIFSLGLFKPFKDEVVQ